MTTMKYKFVGECRGKSISHISFDMVNRETKTFYGVAHYIGWLSMDDIGRVVINGTDDAFDKALALYERGINMFGAKNGIVVIE